jgi:hypothetical protein
MGCVMRTLGKALILALALSGLSAISAYADVSGQYSRPRNDDVECDSKCARDAAKQAKTWEKMIENDLALGRPNRVDVTYNFLFNYYYRPRNFSTLIDVATRGLNWLDASQLTESEKKHVRVFLSDWRGRARQKAGDYPGAYSDFVAAYRGGVEIGRSHYDADQIKQLLDDIKSTSKAIDDAAASAENAANPGAYATYNAGLAKQNSGDFAGALALYDSAISQSPGFAEYWRQRAKVRGKLLDAAGHVADAAHALELYKQENNGPYYYELARGYLQSRKPDESLANTVRAVQASPWERDYYDFYDAGMQVKESEVFPHALVPYLEGKRKFASKDFAGAFADANAAIANDPNYGDYYSLRVKAAMALFYASGKLPEGYSAPYQDALKGWKLNSWNYDNVRALADFDYDVSLPHWNDHPEFYGTFIKEQFREEAYDFYFQYLAHSPDDAAAKANYNYFVELEQKGIQQAQSDSIDRAIANNKAIAEEQEKVRRQEAPDFNDKMQAWCDSIGASSIQNMAALPPACYGYTRN